MVLQTERMARTVAADSERLLADSRGAFPHWEFTKDLIDELIDLSLNYRQSGHAEFGGKTLFIKANTGPSGHGMPPSVGQAVGLKIAGAEDVKVFVFEGEGGLTPGASHESKNSAWGLGLSNLVFFVDWNDFGIDENALSSVVHGTPEDWFAPYGWRVLGTERGMEWDDVTRIVTDAAGGENPAN